MYIWSFLVITINLLQCMGGMQGFPNSLKKGGGKFCWGIFLLGGRNLKRSDFNLWCRERIKIWWREGGYWGGFFQVGRMSKFLASGGTQPWEGSKLLYESRLRHSSAIFCFPLFRVFNLLIFRCLFWPHGSIYTILQSISSKN